ncbi:uncharacterized protein LOC109608384 [Aethina tumida]|uniref:uncharacterized protein LOC109608384 n=1 Tax=Aethina tumida TaxID=116153 RepID=UPI00096B3145|nr:uncharacterized protein LOC109608384 [Aethina tumida]
MFAEHKNSYLQSYYLVDPKLINRLVQKARPEPCIDEHDLTPAFNRLVSEQPPCPSKNVDSSRTPLGFGRRGVQNLLESLRSNEKDEVIASLNTACDLAHDSIYTPMMVKQRVLCYLGLLIASFHENISARTLDLLKILSIQDQAKYKIINCALILKSLESSLSTHNLSIKYKAAELLYELSNSCQTAPLLIDANYIPIIMEKIKDESCSEFVALLLKTLERIIRWQGKCLAMYDNGFLNLTNLLQHSSKSIIVAVLNCLKVLTETRAGKNTAFKMNFLDKLQKFMMHEDPDIHTTAVSVLMNMVNKMKINFHVGTMPNIWARLLELVKCKENPVVQMYAMQTLTTISDVPTTRKFLKLNVEYLRDIPVGKDENLIRWKTNLIDYVNAIDFVV